MNFHGSEKQSQEYQTARAETLRKAHQAGVYMDEYSQTIEQAEERFLLGRVKQIKSLLESSYCPDRKELEEELEKRRKEISRIFGKK